MGFRFLPYKKAKKGVQIAGVDYDDSGGGGGGSYTLPPATASTLGGIKVGSNLSVESDGTLSGSAPYTLPTASSEVLGGVKVGSGLSINDGVLSATGGGSSAIFSTGFSIDSTKSLSANLYANSVVSSAPANSWIFLNSVDANTPSGLPSGFTNQGNMKVIFFKNQYKNFCFITEITSSKAYICQFNSDFSGGEGYIQLS